MGYDDDNIIQDGSEDDQAYRTPNGGSQDDGNNSLANIDEINMDPSMNLDGDALNFDHQENLDEEGKKRKKAKKDKKLRKTKDAEKPDKAERKKEKKRLRKLQKE
jgi:hypothetical protein